MFYIPIIILALIIFYKVLVIYSADNKQDKVIAIVEGVLLLVVALILLKSS